MTTGFYVSTEIILTTINNLARFYVGKICFKEWAVKVLDATCINNYINKQHEIKK